MGNWIKTSSSSGVGNSAAPGNVTLTSAVLIRRFVSGGQQVQQIGLIGTAPSPLGTFAGINVYSEIPDGGTQRDLVGTGQTGTAVASTIREPVFQGQFPYVAGERYLAAITIPDAECTARFYATSYSATVDNPLITADLPSPSPSVTLALTFNPARISGEEYAPVASGFAQTTGYPRYELQNNVWTFKLGFEWVKPTTSPRIGELTGYEILYDFGPGPFGTRLWGRSGKLNLNAVNMVSLPFPCPLSATFTAWLCSIGAEGTNSPVEGVTPKLIITVQRPTDVIAGQEYAPLVTGQTASVAVEQTTDGAEVYTLTFAWDAPIGDELAFVHVWTWEEARDEWVFLGRIEATDNGEQISGPHPFQQPNLFTLWFYSEARDGRINSHDGTLTPHVHLAQITPSATPTIIRARVIPIAAPPAPAANTSTIQTATIGGVPSFRFHLVATSGGGTTAGYLAQARYYSDAGATTPTSDWIPLGWIDLAVTTLDTPYWPRPTVQDYAKVRIAAQTADNALGPWLESAILTRIASTGLDGGQIAATTLNTAAFAATIRPVTLVSTGSALPGLPDALYPPGSVAYIIDAATLVKASSANTWVRLIDGGSDIIAGTIRATEICAHTITAGQIAAGAITTTELYAGEILVGGGTGKPTRFRVNDAGGSQVAFIGDNGAGFVGGYFVNLLIGPTIGAPVISANSGGVTINGAPITLNANGITTIITNASVSGYPAGLRIVKNTTLEEARLGMAIDGSYNNPELFLIKVGAGSVKLTFAGAGYAYGYLTDVTGTSAITFDCGSVYNSGGWRGHITLGGINCVRQLLVNSVEVINSSKQFVGLGVYCPSYEIAGSGFNPYVGGVQYTGLTGSTGVPTNITVLQKAIRTNAGDLEVYVGSSWVSVGAGGLALAYALDYDAVVTTFKGGACTSVEVV